MFDLRKRLVGLEDLRPSREDLEVVGVFNPGVADLSV